MTTRINRRMAIAGLVFGAAGIATFGTSIAQTPESDGTPGASPVASPFPEGFPVGPLGNHLLWLEDSLNSDTEVTSEEVATHFTKDFLANEMGADEIADLINGFAADGGPWKVDTKSIIMTMDFPTSLISFRIDGEGGQTLQGGMTLDRESELLGAFSLAPADEATPAS